jgi:hypothetical protein
MPAVVASPSHGPTSLSLASASSTNPAAAIHRRCRPRRPDRPLGGGGGGDQLHFQLHSSSHLVCPRFQAVHWESNFSSSIFSLVSRSSSLPRTFQREALLRHPELSMELDRLADPAIVLAAASTGGGLSTDDQMSDSGAISAPESVITARKRGKRRGCN